MSNPAGDESQRLAELYRAMSELELRRIAEDVSDLTDAGLAALADEVRRRGLDIPLAHPAVPMEQVEQHELVAVQSFRDLSEGYWQKAPWILPESQPSWLTTTWFG
jgi:hypothetical protein